MSLSDDFWTNDPVLDNDGDISAKEQLWAVLTPDQRRMVLHTHRPDTEVTMYQIIKHVDFSNFEDEESRETWQNIKRNLDSFAISSMHGLQVTGTMDLTAIDNVFGLEDEEFPKERIGMRVRVRLDPFP